MGASIIVIVWIVPGAFRIRFLMTLAMVTVSGACRVRM